MTRLFNDQKIISFSQELHFGTSGCLGLLDHMCFSHQRLVGKVCIFRRRSKSFQTERHAIGKLKMAKMFDFCLVRIKIPALAAVVVYGK